MDKSIQLSTSDVGEVINKELFQTKLVPEIRRLLAIADSSSYAEPESSLRLIHDEQIYRDCETLVKKYQSVDIIIVIGIGGSNLGTMAVQEAVLGRYHNHLAQPQVFYADTVDASGLSQLLAISSEALKSGKRIVLNIISKSGTTTETVANAQLFFDVLEQQKVSLVESVVVTTDRDSALWRVAQTLGLDTLEIPKVVCGRYSVFSSVGIFPLMMMDIDTKGIILGAKAMLEACLSESLDENPAALSALSLFAHYQSGRTIHNTFCFAPNLEGFGKWYRQLTGESLGKINDREGSEVNVGITPTVSIGSNDLHSVVQLYLSGPDNTFTTFVDCILEESLELPIHSPIESLVPNIQRKSVADIMGAIVKGTLFSYRETYRPFQSLTLPDRSANSIGQLLQMKMIEMMFLGALFNINAFDQPAVEIYKAETRRLLQHS